MVGHAVWDRESGFLLEDLSRQIAGKAPNDLVFIGARGAVMRTGTFRPGALISVASSASGDGQDHSSGFGRFARRWVGGDDSVFRPR